MKSDRNIKIRKFLSSESRQVAALVGGRRGRPVILRIASEQMNRDGHALFRSPNGVWLTEQVPVKYIEFPGSETDHAT